jgi:hypothetical protein
MPYVPPDALFAVAQTVLVVLVLSATLIIVLLNLRKPATAPLVIAAGLVVATLLAVTVSPWNVPLLAGWVVGALAVGVAVAGGDPITRRALEIASHGSVREGVRGGILLTDDDPSPSAHGAREREIMRGGVTIGYLERAAVVLSLIAGFPEAIAVVVAIKGVGRFSELASSEARERFIIGTLASMLWAGALGALVRLAVW